MQGKPSFTGAWERARRWPGPDQEKLDRALVAGLLLETILDALEAPCHDQARPGAVKARLKYNLAMHLAGRVSLDQFRGLLRLLDRWFPYYYPLVSPALAPAEVRDEGGTFGLPEIAAVVSPNVLREEELKDWLDRQVREILPQRPHRKLNPSLLLEFLRRTRGGWFRLRDFEAHFGIDRKTAWEYLKKLQDVGLLEHNGGRSAAVRYCLAERFLTVQAGDLRQKIAKVLDDLPPGLTQQVADGLIATGGEAFWEQQWRLPPGEVPRREILGRLEAAGVLQAVVRTAGGRMLRLARGWRRGAND
jgi:hypothetical protein